MTKVYLGTKRIMTSPSPVAAAPPTALSTYAPAPGNAESETRLKFVQYNHKYYNTVCHQRQ